MEWIKGLIPNSNNHTDYDDKQLKKPKYCEYNNQDVHVNPNGKVYD